MSKRASGNGCITRAGGSHRFARRFIRGQVSRVRWLRRRSALYQCRVTWVRKASHRPEGARPGIVGYGPNLQALAVYLMVAHFVPTHRLVDLLESLTGAAPSAGFVHGMLTRAAGLLAEVDKRIRTLITLAYAVSCDETPLRVGPCKPKAGQEEGREVPAGRLRRTVHPLPARRSRPGHLHSLCAARPGRVGDRA